MLEMYKIVAEFKELFRDFDVSMKKDFRAIFILC